MVIQVIVESQDLWANQDPKDMMVTQEDLVQEVIQERSDLLDQRGLQEVQLELLGKKDLNLVL